MTVWKVLGIAERDVLLVKVRKVLIQEEI